jgi:hypothetical protein
MIARRVLLISVGFYIGATAPIVARAVQSRFFGSEVTMVSTDEKVNKLLRNLLTESKKCRAHPCDIAFDAIMKDID